MILFFVGVLGLIGWGIYEAITAPDSGYVTGKNYYPMSVSTHCSGQPSTCTTTVYPARWCLSLRADDGNEGNHCVDEETYRQYPVGSHYPDAR
jgi:hypothetical protein